MSLDAMKQALEALEMVTVDVKTTPNSYEASRQAITVLRAAIEQAQVPVAWVGPSWLNPDTRTWESESFAPRPIKGWIPLYTAPRQWRDLTDEDMKAPIQRAMQHFGYDPTQYSLGGLATVGFLDLVKDIEAKLKAKNA